MNELTRFALTGVIVFMAHTLEGITGFGCTVIALPFITMLLGIKMTVPLLCVFNWIMAIYILARSWRSIQWKEFLFIALWAGIGLPFGMVMFTRMSPAALGLMQAFFMIFVGVQGTWKTLQARKRGVLAQEKAKKTLLMRIILFCGGIIHGAFGTGGPFVVIYASRALPKKSLFRLTLSLLWFSLNSCRLVEWTGGGKTWTPEMGKCILWGAALHGGGDHYRRLSSPQGQRLRLPALRLQCFIRFRCGDVVQQSVKTADTVNCPFRVCRSLFAVPVFNGISSPFINCRKVRFCIHRNRKCK